MTHFLTRKVGIVHYEDDMATLEIEARP